MRIAISTDGKYVSEHFGRCPSFTLVDIGNGKLINRTIIDNPGHSPGYIPEFLHEKGVSCIVCGGMGLRAKEIFEHLGIQSIMGIEGSVEDIINTIKTGVLEGKDSICTPGSGRGYGVEKDECDHPHK